MVPFNIAQELLKYSCKHKVQQWCSEDHAYLFQRQQQEFRPKWQWRRRAGQQWWFFSCFLKGSLCQKFLAPTDVLKCCGLTLVESFLVNLKNFNLWTLILSISQEKVLSHLFFSSSLQNGDILACIEIPICHLLEDDLQWKTSLMRSIIFVIECG